MSCSNDDLVSIPPMIEGDTRQLTYNLISRATGLPYTNLTNWAFKWQMAPGNRPGGTSIIQKATPDMTIGASSVTVTLDPADTQGLGGKAYYHELETTDPFGAVDTPAVGLMQIDKGQVAN